MVIHHVSQFDEPRNGWLTIIVAIYHAIQFDEPLSGWLTKKNSSQLTQDDLFESHMACVGK